MGPFTRRQWLGWGVGGALGLVTLVGITAVGVLLSGWFVVNYAHLSGSTNAVPAGTPAVSIVGSRRAAPP